MLLGPVERCYPYAQNDRWHAVGAYSFKATIALTVVTAGLRGQN